MSDRKPTADAIAEARDQVQDLVGEIALLCREIREALIQRRRIQSDE